MKILLTAINSKYIHSNLAVRYLKKYAEHLDYEGKIREFSINDRVEKILEEIISEKPQVVAFSCYIWNIEYVTRLSKLIKQVDSSIEILYGGPEVSYDSKSYLEEACVDYVIEGEGEKTYLEFVEYKLNSRNLDSIFGIYYKNNGEILFKGARPLLNLNELNFPYEENEDMKNKIVYYEASRGCPFNCKYCLSSTIHGVRFLDLERVKKELKFFVDKKVKLIKFVDRTFNCNVKFAFSVWEYLIDLETDATFHFEISADILTKEQIALLKKAQKGKFQFEIGVQTTNDDVLSNIDRKVNFDDLKVKVLELLEIKNIHQHLDLIIGLPGEDFNSFRNSFNEVYAISPEKLQLGFLKLLKGSAMREEAEKWGMVYSPFPPYEILRNSLLSYKDVVKLKKVEEVFEKYYNSEKFYLILKYFVGKFDTPFDFYEKLGEFFYDKGYMSRAISATDYYKVFIEFDEEVLKENSDVIKQIIKYEFLKFSRKKWIPEFLPKDYTKSTKDIHIERFTIDILEYENTGNVIPKESIIEFYN